MSDDTVNIVVAKDTNPALDVEDKASAKESKEDLNPDVSEPASSSEGGGGAAVAVAEEKQAIDGAVKDDKGESISKEEGGSKSASPRDATKLADDAASKAKQDDNKTSGDKGEDGSSSVAVAEAKAESKGDADAAPSATAASKTPREEGEEEGEGEEEEEDEDIENNDNEEEGPVFEYKDEPEEVAATAPGAAPSAENANKKRQGEPALNLPVINPPNLTMQTRYITLNLRPRDGTWVMDSDLQVSASIDMSIVDLKRWLEATRSIPSERIIVANGKQEIPIPKLREPWPIKRIGIANNEVLIISPTKRGGWIWHPLQHYHEFVLTAVLDEINKKGGYIRLDALEGKVEKPPPVSESLLGLLRQYPDRIHVRTDLVTGLIWVGRAAGYRDDILTLPPNKMLAAMYQLPTFEGGVVDMDTAFPGPEITDIDWSQYDDIDNTGFDMSSVVVPDSLYYIRFPLSDLRLKQVDVFNLPNVFIEVIFKGVLVARTTLQCRTLRPSWPRDHFMLVVRAQEEIRQCTIRINVFSFKIPAMVTLIATAYYADADISDLMIGRVTNVSEPLALKEYPEADGSSEGKPAGQSLVPTIADAKTAADASSARSRSGSVFGALLGGARESMPLTKAVSSRNLAARVSNAALALADGSDDEAMGEGDGEEGKALESALDYFREFDLNALEKQQSDLVPSPSKVMFEVIHSEYELRILFCSGLLNIEDPSGGLKMFVSIIFNGRELFTSSVQDGQNAKWDNPPTVFIRLGGLELHECTMSIETWKMGEVGRENKLGLIEYNGKQFKSLLANCEKRVNRYAADLYILPRSKDAKEEPGKKKKIAKKGPAAKPVKTGTISFDIGPPGLPSGNYKSFDLQILSGVDLPSQKIICDIYWNDICIGMTNVAEYENFNEKEKAEEEQLLDVSSEEEDDEFVKAQKAKAKQRETAEQKKARREKAKKEREAAEAEALAKAKDEAVRQLLSDPWIWAPKVFKFSIYDDADLLSSSLKIFICEGSDKINPKNYAARLGCLYFGGEELVKLLTFPDSYSKEVVQDVGKDPTEKRAQKAAATGNGKVKIRCGLSGARMPNERTVLILACKIELNQLIKFWKPHNPLEVLPDKVSYFVKVYFNDVYLGDSTTCTVEDGQDPWWNDSWVHLPIGELPLKECQVRFELFMLFIPGNEEPETTNMLGVTTGKKSQVGKGAALPEKDTRPVYTPFILGSALAEGKDLKTVLGPKSGATREFNLEPYVSQEKKKSWFDKSSGADLNRTHQLLGGVLQVGSPGLNYVIADDSAKAKAKEVQDVYSMFSRKCPPTVVVPVVRKPEGGEEESEAAQGDTSAETAPAKSAEPAVTDQPVVAAAVAAPAEQPAEAKADADSGSDSDGSDNEKGAT